jgi:hypothetical protein
MELSFDLNTAERIAWAAEFHRAYCLVSLAPGGSKETDEDILTFDVSDEALERTTSTEWQAFTWIYCTGAWQYCPA